MSAEDRHIARLRVRVVERDVLLYGEMQRLLLLISCGAGILPDVLARHIVLDNPKHGG